MTPSMRPPCTSAAAGTRPGICSGHKISVIARWPLRPISWAAPGVVRACAHGPASSTPRGFARPTPAIPPIIGIAAGWGMDGVAARTVLTTLLSIEINPYHGEFIKPEPDLNGEKFGKNLRKT